MTNPQFPLPSRRRFLQLAGLATAGVALSGCSVGGQKRETSTVEQFWQGKKQTGNVRFANWPLYIDPKRPELKAFTKDTGIKVDYREDVQENASFAGKVQPKLADGSSTGYDMFVLTNGLELARFLELGYLAPLDHGRMPNFAEHAGEIYRNAAYDKGNQFTVPYASGITGIAYNPEYVDKEITSIADLWDPKFKGHVGMFADAQEIANFGLLLNGVAPAESGESDWQAAADKLKQQRDAGVVRAYYSQDYIQPLTTGDVWLTMAWSGDIFQQNAEEGTDLEFVVPEEGATLWTDNMMIPATSEAPVDAITLMDYLYDPEVAASLASYINYIPPVPGARDVLRSWADEAKGDEKAELTRLVDSPLVFPDDADYERLHSYVSVAPAEQQKFTSQFHAITQA